MHSRRRSYIYLHIAILLWGFTAVLGDLISVSALSLVWWRVLISAGLLLFWPGLIGQLRQMKLIWLRRYAYIGVIVGLHWLAFYGSIKLANASIALIAMSTGALFTAFIEPFVFKNKIAKLDILVSLLVIPAMFLIATDFDQQKIVGLVVGIVSAALAAYFTVLNKQWTNDASAEAITWVEMSAAWVVMSLIIVIQAAMGQTSALMPTNVDFVYLLLLAAGCTILPFILHLKSLKHISAFTSNLFNNLEPVYGIILAAIILRDYEELSSTFYYGVVLLMLIVFLYPLLKRKKILSVSGV